MLVVAPQRDPQSAAWRLLTMAEPLLSVRVLCGAAGLEPPPGRRIFQPFEEESFLAEAEPGFDGTQLSQGDGDLLAHLADFLRDGAPEIVHLYDLAPFGVEFIGLIRRVLPQVPILVTLSRDLAARLGITGPPRGYLHAAPLRRFLAETTLLLPCESMMPACLAFGLDPARLLVRPPLLPRMATSPLPPLGRFLVIACFAETPADAALLAATAELLAAASPPGNGLRLETPSLETPSLKTPSLKTPSLETQGPERLAGAHLMLLPHADPYALAPLALVLGRPVICAAEGPVAERVKAGRDGWHIPMNPTALAHLLLDLYAAPDAVAAMAATLVPPADAGAALMALYRECVAEPARSAPPERI